jgi:hypothetical protein
MAGKSKELKDGVVEQMTIPTKDKQQAANRSQTGDNSGQRPVMTSNSVKTDKGSFTFKG